MTDPERFLDQPPSELGGLLLRAGTEEGPSHRSLQRTLSALGVGVTALGAAGSASALGAAAGAAGTAAIGAKVAGSLGVAVLAKWASVGVASGIVVALAMHGVTRAERHAPVADVSAAKSVVVSNPSAEIAEVPRVGVVAAEHAEAVPSAVAPSVTSSLRVVAEEEPAPLAAEVAFVDRGRAAYQRGDLFGAERELAGYEREFAEPRLLPEVLYLRMEIATRRGERARAVALAERILRQHARSPHAARARVVLRSE